MSTVTQYQIADPLTALTFTFYWAGNAVPLSLSLSLTCSPQCGFHGGGWVDSNSYTTNEFHSLLASTPRVLSFSRVSAICKLHNLCKIQTAKWRKLCQTICQSQGVGIQNSSHAVKDEVSNSKRLQNAKRIKEKTTRKRRKKKKLYLCVCLYRHEFGAQFFVFFLPSRFEVFALYSFCWFLFIVCG